MEMKRGQRSRLGKRKGGRKRRRQKEDEERQKWQKLQKYVEETKGGNKVEKKIGQKG